MGMSDAGLQIHGGLAGTEPVTGTNIGSTNSQVSDYSLDFGAQGTVPSTSSDIVGLTYPSAATMQRGGEGFGLHIIITNPYVSGDSGAFPAVISALTCDTKDSVDNTLFTMLGARSFTLAQFEVDGAHYFIPISPGFKRYLYAWWKGNASATTAATGKVFMYFGPGPAGAN